MKVILELAEYVDAASVTNEGATVGWNSTGEWLEYYY